MKNYPKFLKEKLVAKIQNLSTSDSLYVKNPGKDFTRERKLPFAEIVQMIISMGGNTIYKELLENKAYSAEVATTSAFVQQRSKIFPKAFEDIFQNFLPAESKMKRYRGYRLLAVDGSELLIPSNPLDIDSQHANQYKNFNLLHMNVLYDLCNHLYMDAVLQSVRTFDERKALCSMVQRSAIGGKVIILGDRGFENYNCFAHIGNKGWNYVIRVKDIYSNGILSGLSLPDGEFDITVTRLLTRKLTKKIKSDKRYRFMPQHQIFDFLPPGSDDEFPISFRIVRFKLSSGEFASVITNLPPEDFNSTQIKELYAKRWGIETSFRTLKHTIGLTNFHAKKRELIAQEIFARLTMYNFCEMITAHVVFSQAIRKHDFQVNFTVAVHVCRRFLRSWGNAPPLEVEALIRKNVLPVRPNRKHIRKACSKSVVCFVYRVA